MIHGKFIEKKKTMLLLFALCVVSAVGANTWAQPEDELIRGAKKEGKVVFWSSMRVEDSRALAAGFEAKYPFIKVDIFRAGGEQIVARPLVTARFGTRDASVEPAIRR